MKTIIVVITVLSLSLTSSILAQSNTSVNYSKTQKSSVSVVSSTNGEKNYNRSFSFLDLDNSYHLKIKFMSYMKNDVENYLKQQFDPLSQVMTTGQLHWIQKSEDDIVYDVDLKGNRLKIYLNKKKASINDIEKLYSIAEELKKITARPE